MMVTLLLVNNMSRRHWHLGHLAVPHRNPREVQSRLIGKAEKSIGQVPGQRERKKGKGQGKGGPQDGEPVDWAYGPARPMTAEERSQFGLQNREWLLRWLSSLTPEERAQAGIPPGGVLMHGPCARMTRFCLKCCERRSPFP